MSASSSSSLVDAIAQWNAACADATAKAKAAAGDDFIAAGCGETNRVSTLKFESKFTVWKRHR